jgi:hypothetical protein
MILQIFVSLKVDTWFHPPNLIEMMAGTRIAREERMESRVDVRCLQTPQFMDREKY